MRFGSSGESVNRTDLDALEGLVCCVWAKSAETTASFSAVFWDEARKVERRAAYWALRELIWSWALEG